MTYRGKFHNGAVVFDEAVPFPEGSEVTCQLFPVEKPGIEASEPEVGEQPFAFLLKYSGIVKDAPRDFSENHDKYLYGKYGQE